LLSGEYKNNYTKLKVLCSCGKIFFRSYDKICNTGQILCSKCGGLGATQKKVLNIVKNAYPNHTINSEQRFEWLGLQSIDIYIPDLKIAIEYDGEQHFGPVQFGGISMKKAQKNLKRQKGWDRKKNKLIKQHPEDVKHFIRIPYTEKINEKNVLDIINGAIK